MHLPVYLKEKTTTWREAKSIITFGGKQLEGRDKNANYYYRVWKFLYQVDSTPKSELETLN